MHIEYVEISNFRKLLSVRIDLANETTLLVGANNSGKTSAMIAMRNFLVSPEKFCMNDFTLSHWPRINNIGLQWTDDANISPTTDIADWAECCPTMDIWLCVQESEVHYVSKLIPTLDWGGGLLGVRLRYEPENPEKLRKNYLAARESVTSVKSAHSAQGHDGGKFPKLWPENMIAFLEEKLRSHFCIRTYALDPSKINSPLKGQARPQALNGQEPIEGNPLKPLIRVDEINAQRGFGHLSESNEDADKNAHGSRKLSAQLKKYYKTHLDPFKNPESEDIVALQAIEVAQEAFDKRLAGSFKSAMDEVQGLGYPGISDPKITISTRLRPVDGLDHETAVQYELDTVGGEYESGALRLPEDFNGLGYQNLISMIFRLMSFRDSWMRVGKAQNSESQETTVQPLHLVLVEEPEAHLHAQVQQVFIKKAYRVLRYHPVLGADKTLATQLVVSTHSSHVAHEIDFSCLRYFHRLPAGIMLPSSAPSHIPISTVVNLSEVFGKGDETQRFVARYLKTNHCDLFFADAAIMVEGSAERMLVPHFIRRHEYLNQCFITILEIGGSHAHRFKSLIEHLGLLTLIFADLDAISSDNTAATPKRGKNQCTSNPTLKEWIPQKNKIDDLLELKSEFKMATDDNRPFAIRVSYQLPVKVSVPKDGEKEEALSNTFEDALVFQNIEFFRKLDGVGLVKKFHDAIANSADASSLSNEMFAALRNGNKAQFALDVIFAEDFELLEAPTYIAEGLDWLQDRLKKKRTEKIQFLEGEKQ